MMKYYLKTIKALLAGLIVAVAAGSAQAADYYWDQNGTDPGFGDGSGTWGTDQFWTESTDGSFTSPAGGVLTTLLTDTVTINEAKVDNAVSSVSGDVHALTLWGPASSGAIDTFIDNVGGGTIHLYAVADMTDDNSRQNTAAINGRGNDTHINIAAPIVLEQAGGSDVVIDAHGGNNSGTFITGSITSTNTVNLTFNGAGHGAFGDLDLKGGSFTGLMRAAHNRALTMNGVIGSGVSDVLYDGWFNSGLNRITTLILANPANTYTGDTILTEGRLRITTDTSLPATTHVYITSPGIAGDTSLVLDNPDTNIIAGLSLGGVEQDPGVYNAANGLGFLSGSGSLEVVSSGGSNFVLTIAQSGANLDLTWNSQAGKVYDLISSTDLSIPRASWPVWESNENIPASGSGTNLLTIPLPPSDPTRFFAVLEKDPLPFYEEDFEADDGGYTLKVAGATGSSWEHGDPDSTSPGGDVLTGNGGSTNCWGTNLGLADAGEYIVPTETCLRSPVIDLTGVTGAELTFAEALDLQDDDTAVVNIINATTDDVILAAVYTADDSGEVSLAKWKDVPAIDITAAVGQMVRIEWCLSGTTLEYLGWYIDDVKVTETAPE